MARALKARPTEYKGVRYRSKCEAMFARWLEMEKERGIFHGFQYEPKSFSVGDYTPDFLTWQVSSSLPVLRYFVIEYKPSIPTCTYLEQLGAKAMRIRSQVFAKEPDCPGVGFAVACGGFFENEQSWFTARLRDGKAVFDEIHDPWLDEPTRKIIAATRFDLEQ